MKAIYNLISALYLLLLTFNSHAYSQQRLFVSKINVEENVSITNSQWNSLNEELIIVIRNNIDTKEYTLLSSENITELLSPDTKLEDCIGKCIVKVGREVQAHIAVHGNLRQVNDSYYLYLTVTKMSNAEILEKTSIEFNFFTEVFYKLKKIKLLKPKLNFDINNLDKKIQSKLFEIKQCSVSLWKRNMYKNTMSFFVFVHKKGLILKGEYELENSEKESYCLTNVLNSISIDPFENDNDIFKKLFIFKIDKDWKEHREYLKSIDEYEGLNENGAKIIPKSKRHLYDRQSVFERRIVAAGLNNKNLNYDYDGDGILDINDQCPVEPEDHDGFRDEDGCPDLYAVLFSRSEFDKVLSTRSDRLLRCIEHEYNRSPNKNNFKVSMTVHTSGHFIKAHLVDGSSQGARCVIRAIRGLKMSSFNGSSKTIVIPYETKRKKKQLVKQSQAAEILSGRLNKNTRNNVNNEKNVYIFDEEIVPRKPSKQNIISVLRSAEIKHCLAREPKLIGAGKILVQIVAVRSGMIKTASVINHPFKSSPAASCIEREIRRLKFSKFSMPKISFKFPFKN